MEIEYKFSSEQVALNNKQNLDHITEKINLFKSELVEEMISYGMTFKVAEKAIAGGEIKICNNCKTPNLYLDNDVKMHNIKIYRCDNCNSFHYY